MTLGLFFMFRAHALLSVVSVIILPSSSSSLAHFILDVLFASVTENTHAIMSYTLFLRLEMVLLTEASPIKNKLQ